MREKGFAATSIQDITARANVNRGTFYLHFTDKYMLLDALLKQSAGKETSWRVPVETIARVVSLAIFGAVLQWSQEESLTTTHKSNSRLRSHICKDSSLYVACGGHFVRGTALIS